jgi:hypothetical protein
VVESYLELADKQTNISNVAAAIQAEKWLPKLRNTTFIVVLLLAPVCFLLVFFAPGAVMRWYGGMYVWLILWGSVDQLIFVIYQYELSDLFRSMRSSGLGITQVLDIKSDMLESMGMYGKMRWTSMSLSLAMCMGILKIGNHAMSGIAEGMGSAAQQSAGQAAGALSGAGGTDAARDALTREKARGWAAGMTDSAAIANQAQFDYNLGIQNALQKTGQFGDKAAAIEARSNTDGLLSNIGQQDVLKAIGKVLGTDIAGASAFKAGGGILNDDLAKHLQGQGIKNAQAGDSLNFGINQDGTVGNMSLERYGNNGRTTFTYNNDGTLANSSFSGVKGGQQVTEMRDGNGNLINHEGVSGRSDHHRNLSRNESGRIVTNTNTTENRSGTSNVNFNINSDEYTDSKTHNVGKSVNIGNETLQNAVMGDKKSIHDMGMFGDNKELSQQLAMQTVNTLAIFTQQSSSNSTNVTAGLSARGSSAGFTGQTSETYNAILLEGMQKHNEIFNSEMTQGNKEGAWADYLGSKYDNAASQYDRGAALQALDRAAGVSGQVGEGVLKFLADKKVF